MGLEHRKFLFIGRREIYQLYGYVLVRVTVKYTPEFSEKMSKRIFHSAVLFLGNFLNLLFDSCALRPHFWSKSKLYPSLVFGVKRYSAVE